MVIETLKIHKSPGADKISAEFIQVGGRTIRSEIHYLINSVWNKKKLPEAWKEAIIVPIYKKGDWQIVVLRAKLYPTSYSQRSENNLPPNILTSE
jgi:hypothetical protein